MRYYEKLVEGKPIFYLQGDLTGDTETVSLCSRIMECADAGSTDIILEFGDVHIVNSQAIGMLLSCTLRLRRQGGDICFVKVHQDVLAYLQTTRINRILRIYETTDEAVNELVFTRLYV